MHANQVLWAMYRRRSVRHSIPQEAKDDLLLAILEAGRWVPSFRRGLQEIASLDRYPIPLALEGHHE